MTERPSTIKKRELLSRIRHREGCVDCGTTEGLLHFDHRDGTVKELEVAHLARYKMSRIMNEVAKCDVRCAACHERRHRTLPEEERKAREKARWQRWYAVNKERRSAYGKEYRARRTHGIWHKEEEAL